MFTMTTIHKIVKANVRFEQYAAEEGIPAFHAINFEFKDNDGNIFVLVVTSVQQLELKYD